jgi:hypothetical protein
MKDYLIVRNFINQDRCVQMVEKIKDFMARGLDLPPDNQCPTSPGFYGVFNDELTEFLPRIEQLVGKELYPTYTYSRIYQPGEILLPHTDRNECEYSFTLALEYDGEIWPIYVQTESGVQEILLDNGDILIYKGIDLLHWRMRLENRYHYQGFFHCVDKNGPYANRKYDSRETFASTQDAVDELLRKRNVLL